MPLAAADTAAAERDACRQEAQAAGPPRDEHEGEFENLSGSRPTCVVWNNNKIIKTAIFFTDLIRIFFMKYMHSVFSPQKIFGVFNSVENDRTIYQCSKVH